ncbi:LysR substrate-binding domain-containing protein [Azohydromonas sediminis]|uniref:LysR substrate-binding domain-containing protein n=1 Tax=Azohydromonas sediminis TaxID=2259674 RepID=UPI000E64F534|nr:LysR substrate-binding domain-containing protein [Azohydromonas sediminis]
MELRHLRYFDALAETLNFSRAAERLHVTQSTLSHQIRQLEDEIGSPLFERSTRHVRLTEAGELLRSYATPALQQIDRALQALRPHAGDPLQGSLRLGTTHSFATRLVPMCVSSFIALAPGTVVSVQELSAREIAQRLAKGALDLGVSYRPADAPDLWFEPLYHEELKLVVAAGHPLARRRRVRMVELHGVRMVLLPGEFSTRQLLDEAFEAAGAEPRVVVELNSVAPMLELIRRTDLAGIVAETALTPSDELAVVPLEDPTPRRTPGLLWKKGAARSPTMRHMAAVIRRAVGRDE